MRTSNLISPDFTEDTVSLMVQILLTIPRFPKVPFALVPLSKNDELIYGADAYIDSISPFYIQFKKSFAYPDYSTSKIIKDRKQLGLNYSPKTLFFKLHNKKPEHNDYQHNILFDLNESLSSSGSGKAFYTAPLFLNRMAYLKAVYLSSILCWRPWNWLKDNPFQNESLNVISHTGVIHFQNIPILKEHIVIPPHDRVETHKHKYSYLENGSEICFHKPTKLNSGKTLGQTINDYLNFKDGQPTTKMIDLKKSISLLNKLRIIIGEGKHTKTDALAKENILENWISFGEKLRNEYDIFQFFLIKLKK